MDQIKEKKKVTFKEEKNLVVIINVESYKKYNNIIDIGGNKNNKQKQNKDFIVHKNRKKSKEIQKLHLDENYFDKDMDSGKSCLIF